MTYNVYMQSKVKTVEEYIETIPENWKQDFLKVREMILSNLPHGYEEVIQYGMIGYIVPLSMYKEGYLNDPTKPLPFVGLASQKNYMSLYLMCIYSSEHDREQFEREYTKTGKKLDMGKSCIRFKKADELAFDVIGNAIRRIPIDKYIKIYTESRKKK